MDLLRPVSAASSSSARRTRPAQALRPMCQFIHSSAPRTATPSPHPTVPGPPPQPPQAAAGQAEDRIARKKNNAESLQRGQALKVNPSKPSSASQKRFWKDVSVKETPDGSQVMLDTRPVRTAGKKILTLPHDKRALATAIALEWDQSVSAQQASKHHYIPLTSMTSRAVDMQEADSKGDSSIRQDVVKMLMRYLETDTLSCWAPEKNSHDPTAKVGLDKEGNSTQSLRDTQIAAATPIIGFLKTHVFPGVDIEPISDEDSIMPKAQPKMTQEVIRGWLSGSSAFDLAAVERGVLASKSSLVAIRLLVEWSKEFKHSQPRKKEAERFGIAQAAEASNIEVAWQTNMWGEVEDTHDVNREDMARQSGSVVLLVS